MKKTILSICIAALGVLSARSATVFFSGDVVVSNLYSGGIGRSFTNCGAVGSPLGVDLSVFAGMPEVTVSIGTNWLPSSVNVLLLSSAAPTNGGTFATNWSSGVVTNTSTLLTNVAIDKASYSRYVTVQFVAVNSTPSNAIPVSVSLRGTRRTP